MYIRRCFRVTVAWATRDITRGSPLPFSSEGIPGGKAGDGNQIEQDRSKRIEACKYISPLGFIILTHGLLAFG